MSSRTLAYLLSACGHVIGNKLESDSAGVGVSTLAFVSSKERAAVGGTWA
jgi:hypothetical protein